MSFSFDSKIRYSESDIEGCLTLSALLNYFQDCSTFQSESLDVGIRYLKERHMVWVLSYWQIDIERYPRFCEEVEIGTFPTSFRHFLGTRNFYMKEKSGKYLAKANSLWSLLDTDTMKPTIPPQDMINRYLIEDKLDMEYLPRKVGVPCGGSMAEPVVVRSHHLDTNRHVNNGQYVNMAMDYLPKEFAGTGIRRLRAEYRMQAFLGDVLYPYVAVEGDTATVSLQDQGGNPYVNIAFSR